MQKKLLSLTSHLPDMGKFFSKRKSTKHSGAGEFDSIDQHPKGSNSDTVRYGNRSVSMPTKKDPVHTDAVVSLAAIQPGLCLSGSKDKSMVLYDYHNHRLEDRWTGHEREITKVCYGAACQGIFSASRDKTIRLWRRGYPSCLREYSGHELVVTAIHLNKDCSWLCSGSRDNSLKLWDVESGSCLCENTISRNLVTDVKFIPDTHLLVQTGEDKEVRLFDTRTMQVCHSFPRKQYIQMSCDVSSDGMFCLTCSNGFGGNGCEATLWDLRTQNIMQEYKGHTEAVEACIFLPPSDRALLATSSRDGSVRVWDRDTRAEVAQAVISCSGPLTSLIAYEGNSICVSSFNNGIHHLQLSLPNETLINKSQF